MLSTRASVAGSSDSGLNKSIDSITANSPIFSGGELRQKDIKSAEIFVAGSSRFVNKAVL